MDLVLIGPCFERYGMSHWFQQVQQLINPHFLLHNNIKKYYDVPLDLLIWLMSVMSVCVFGREPTVVVSCC